MRMEVLQLSDSHGWKARPGHRILVLDRGAVRFDFPRDWTVCFKSNYVYLLDGEPSNETCALAVSFRRVSGIAAYTPLPGVLQESVRQGPGPAEVCGPPVRFRRWPLEGVWLETRNSERSPEARSYSCLARAGCTIAFMTFDFRMQDQTRLCPVWNTVLDTLTVGEYVDDPVTGRKREQRG